MTEIDNTHFDSVEENLLNNALDAFYEIREMREIKKKPSTSELVDWIRALQLGGIPAERIKKELPFAGTIIKKDEDMEAVIHKAM